MVAAFTDPDTTPNVFEDGVWPRHLPVFGWANADPDEFIAGVAAVASRYSLLWLTIAEQVSNEYGSTLWSVDQCGTVKNLHRAVALELGARGIQPVDLSETGDQYPGLIVSSTRHVPYEPGDSVKLPKLAIIAHVDIGNVVLSQLRMGVS